jgi:hypothetical protein
MTSNSSKIVLGTALVASAVIITATYTHVYDMKHTAEKLQDLCRTEYSISCKDVPKKEGAHFHRHPPQHQVQKTPAPSIQNNIIVQAAPPQVNQNFSQTLPNTEAQNNNAVQYQVNSAPSQIQQQPQQSQYFNGVPLNQPAFTATANPICLQQNLINPSACYNYAYNYGSAFYGPGGPFYGFAIGFNGPAWGFYRTGGHRPGYTNYNPVNTTNSNNNNNGRNNQNGGSSGNNNRGNRNQNGNHNMGNGNRNWMNNNHGNNMQGHSQIQPRGFNNPGSGFHQAPSHQSAPQGQRRSR